DAAKAGTDHLDADHQRIGEQHGPQHAVAELRTGLRIGGDTARIIIGGAGDEARPQLPYPRVFRNALEQIDHRRTPKNGWSAWASGGNKRIKLGANRIVRAICAFRVRQDGASEGKALSSQSAGAVHAALITTGTTHEDSLCDLTFWQDRLPPRMCKELI